MALGDQEQKSSIDHEMPATEPPTAAFEGKPGETVPTAAADLSAPSSDEVCETLAPGQMLGQYRILERLGSGGMGHVYKAVHPVMERTVALKIISPRLMQEPSARARFHREVRNAARLIHPNIVVAHDAAEVDGLWFLVMEYIEGKDIAQMLSRYSRPPVGLACEIIRQAALGLQYAHENGLVHRDIKPANLMVANARPRSDDSTSAGWPEAPVVKILDLGLARLSVVEGAAGTGETLTREGCIVGTPEYMAPEQARDSRLVDIRGDIYSLGCTMYMLLAGRPPFKAASSLEMAVMHFSQPPEPVAHYNPALPPEVSALLHRMLAKRPEERVQTPGEVARILQPWSRCEPGAPAPVGAYVPPVAHVAPPSSGFANSSFPPPPSSGVRPRSAPSLPGAPPSTPSLPARPAIEEPKMPPTVMMMHFQVVLRTILLTIIFAVIGIGGLIFLPRLVERAQHFWDKTTPKTTETAPSQ